MNNSTIISVLIIVGLLMSGCTNTGVSQTQSQQPVVKSEKEIKLETERENVITIYKNLNEKTVEWKDNARNFDFSENASFSDECKRFTDMNLIFLTYSSESDANLSASYKKIANLLGENETCIQAISQFDNESQNYFNWEKQVFTDVKVRCDTGESGESRVDEEANRAMYVEELINKTRESCPKVDQYTPIRVSLRV
jgi:hypothetical protein